MFGLGISEMIIIILLVLVIVKPEDYPKIAKEVGKIYRKLTLFWKSILNEIDFFNE